MTKTKGPSTATRKRVYSRDGDTCIGARHPLGNDVWYHNRYGYCYGPLTTQHRMGRGMGGSNLPFINVATNLLAMCEHHNELIEKDAAYRRLAVACGWSIPRNRRPMLVPAEVPVRYTDGTYLLTSEGFRFPIPAALAMELWETFGLIDSATNGLHSAVA